MSSTSNCFATRTRSFLVRRPVTWGAFLAMPALVAMGCGPGNSDTSTPDGATAGESSGSTSSFLTSSSSTQNAGGSAAGSTDSSSNAGASSGGSAGDSSTSGGSDDGGSSGLVPDGGGTAGDATAPDAPSGASDAGASGSSTDGSAPSAFAVTTQRYGIARNGANTSETTLTVAKVGGGKFGQLFSHAVDGHMYANPLYMPGLVINGATHNVVFVETEHDTVYAFDADSATATAPLWMTSLGTPMNAIVSTLGWKKIPMSPGATVTCADMFPASGITGTPVIDPATGRMYLVAKTFDKNTGAYALNMHALDIHTGKDVAGSPVVVRGSVPGTGLSSSGGMITFDPAHHMNRPGLLLLNGNVYVAFGSHCDDPPYHGWVFVYGADTLAQKAIFNTTPNGADGSIWQSGFGLTSDGTNVYFTTANGDFDTQNGGKTLGMSVVKAHLDPTGLTVLDWWTAENAAALNAGDIDLTTGPVLLPNPNVLVTGGKDGYLYVIDPAAMGKFTSGSNKIIQTLYAGAGHFHGSPVYWDGPSGPSIFIWPEAGPLHLLTFNGKQINPTPMASYTGDKPTHPGGMLSLSSDGPTAGTAILWATLTSTTIDPVGGGDAWHHLVPGLMYAFDATNLTKPIWSSVANKARDDIGIFAKFQAPIVANGKVYLATQGKPDGGTLRVYGLLP